MAERVYKKKANITTGVTLPAEGAPLPAAPQSNSLSVPTVGGQTTQRVYKKKATTPTLSGEVGQTTQRTYTIRPEVKAQKLQTWIDDAMSTIKATQDYITQNEGKYNREFGSEYSEKIGELLSAAQTVSEYVDLYQEDAKTHEELKTAIADMQGYLQDFNTYAAAVRESHGQYADETEYQEAVDEAQRYEESLQVDTWELKNTIQFTKDIIDIIEQYRFWENTNPDNNYDPGGNGAAVVHGNRRYYSQLLSYYGYSPEDKKDLEEKLAADEETYNAALRAQVQEAVATAEQDPDYAIYTEEGAATPKPTLDTYDKIAAEMTAEQKETYNYLLGKLGEDAADIYFEMVRGDIQQDYAEQFHSKYLDGRFYEGVWSVVQGLDSTFTKLQNAFGKIDTDDRTFDPQAVGALVSEDLGEKGAKIAFGKTAAQLGYDLATTTAAMLPAIGAGKLATLIHPVAGAVVTPTVIALSAGGGAYKEARDRGYEHDRASRYGLLVGASEALLNVVLNGVSLAGHSLTGNAIKNATAGIKNAAARFAVELGGQMLSEATEEGLQEILTPFFENIALDADNTWDDIDWEQAGYSALMGALSAGVLDGAVPLASVAVNAAKQNAQYRNLGRQFLDGKDGVTIDDAIQIGLNNAKGTDAYKAAVKIGQAVQEGGTVSAYTVGRMVAESQTEQAQRARAIEREVLESAAQVGYDTAAAETISMAAVALNQRVRFATESELGNSNNAGEYHRDTDTVLLNPALTDTDMLIGTIFAHEMTHTAEGTKQLATLAKIAQRMEGAKAWESRKAEIKAEYDATGQTLDPKAVESEALANWIGENLFTDKTTGKAFAQAVADGDANVGNAFFYMIDRVRRAMGAKKASAGNLAMLERLFMQALDNRTVGPKEGAVQYSLGYNNAIDQLAAGKLDRAQNTHLKLLDHTPQLYIEKAGAKDLKIIARWDTAYLAMYKDGDIPGNYHGLGPDVMKAIPKALQDPLYIIKQKNGRIVAITEITVKGKRPVIVSIELDTFQSTTQDGSNEAQNYNLIVTFTDAKVNYLQNTIFSGNIVHRKNNEDPAHFILRLKSLKKALSNDDLAAPSDTNVAQKTPGVNTHSMQEGAGVSTEDGGNSAQGALLPPEYRPGARAEGVDPNVESGAETPSVADGDTSLREGGLRGLSAADAATRGVEGAAPYSADSGAVQVDEAAVLESAVRSGLQGKKVVDVEGVTPSADGYTSSTAADAAVDTIIEQLGEEEALRRMWNAAQMHRPTGMVDIDGKRVDANAYMDAYEQSLPRDKAALERHIADLQEQRAAEVVKMEQEGTLEDYRFGGLKLDLQLFAATRLWDLLQLDEGESGKNARQFYEKRLRGTDANHNQELVDLLAGRSETYNPIATEKTLEKAKNKLRDSKYQEKLIKRIGKYNPRDLFSATDVAAAQVLINDAINDGELDVAADLITGLSRKGTEAGRAVQAFSIMARLTPEGTLRAAIRTVKADADSAICEGANEGLDVLADDIARAIQEAAGNGLSSEEIANRIRNGEVTLSDDGDTSSTASGPPSPQGEGYGTADEPLTTEQISKMQNLTPGKRVSFYDLTDEQVQAFAPLENRLYRELKNKSPFIRRRFGEWRVRDKTPVQMATKAGQKRGVQKNTDTGWNIQVSGKVFGENRGHFGSSSIAARPYLAYINDITRNAVLLDTSTLYEGKSPNSLCMHTLYALADIGDGPQLLKLYVEEMYDPNQKGVNRRAYELLNIESQPIGAKGSQQNAVSPVTLPTDTPTIADLIAIVKSKDASYKPKAPEDVLVDDLAATEGTYLTRDDVAEIVEKAVNDATNIPEQLKRYVLKKIRKDDGGLAQRIYELHKRGDLKQVRLRRAMESTLELPTLTDDDLTWLAQQGAKIESLQDKPVEQADAMGELYDFLGAKLTVSGLDRLQSWRKFGMLFNVKTHLRNVFSNAAYYGIRKADDAVAMAIERLFVRDRSKWGTALGWSHTEHGQSILPQLQEQAELAVLEMQKKGAKYEGTGNSVIKQKRKFFGLSKFGEMLNGLNRRNSEWLEREDVWFFKPAYIDALGQVMTARGVTEITPELHELAMQRALEATFRADNAISDVISSLKRFQNESATGKRLFGHGVDVVIPFHKTPANIATQIVMHSPVGIIKGAFDIHNATVGKGSKDVATAINTMAKGITGSALLAIGILLGTLGAFNAGFGKTEKERAADEMAGLQEGAFVINGVSVSLDWLQPAASPLVVGASIGERMKEEGISLSGVFGAVMDGTDSLFELTMLQSLYDILGGYDAGASGTLMSVGENVVSQSVPTLVGQVARSIDPTQRKTKGDNDFETILNQVVAKIPGLTYLLDPELDVWGNEVYRTGKPSTGTAVLNAAQQVVIPANTKVGTGQGDPISQEILRLYEEQGGAVIPTAITRDEAKDAGEDYVDVNKLLGGVNRLAVEALINNQVAYDLQVETGELTEKGNPKTKKVTKYYREMTDDERRKVLSRIYSNTKDGVIGDASEKTEEQLTDSERYIRDLLRRVRNGEQGTSVAAEAAPEQQQEDTSYYEDLLRRMRNGN